MRKKANEFLAVLGAAIPVTIDSGGVRIAPDLTVVGLIVELCKHSRAGPSHQTVAGSCLGQGWPQFPKPYCVFLIAQTVRGQTTVRGVDLLG